MRSLPLVLLISLGLALLLTSCGVTTTVEKLVYLDEDFSEGLSGWTQFDSRLDDDSPAGDWSVQNGKLVQSNDCWGGGTSEGWTFFQGTQLHYGDESWRDYRFSVDVTPANDNGIGIYSRISTVSENSRRYIRVFIMNNPLYGGPYWRLDMRDNTETYAALVKNQDVGFVVGETFRVIMEVDRGDIRVYNGSRDNLVFEFDLTSNWHDTMYAGKVGLMAFKHPGITFDNVKVEEL